MQIKPKSFLLPPMALRKVISRSGKGVYASSDTLFKGAVFGRDSIEVAEDLLDTHPKLVRRIILTLASLQGEVDNDKNEEEPGKIVHEYRTDVVDGKPLDDISKHIFKELASRWGGDEHTMTYYGSIDATPHFIRLVGRYCDKYGDKILNERVALRSGHKLSILVVLENATEWLIKQITQSQSHLLEYKRRNPLGIENQVWKDSGEFYVHEDGQLANHNAPIASIEVQGLVVDAFMTASKFFPAKADEFRKRAHIIRDTTVWLLWQPQHKYFALGTDYDKQGNLRVINTLTANPGALLDTAFFDDLPEAHRQEYITAIVKAMVGRDFLTDAGIRSRALSAADLVSFWDYHGSYTSWPKETYDIAKGLRRQGFPKLADELENRLLNVVFKNWMYPEYLYVDEWGRVLAVSPSPKGHSEVIMVDSTNSPERIQAWTVSAILAILNKRFLGKIVSFKPLLRSDWQINLEKRLIVHIPRVKPLYNPFRLHTRYPTLDYRLIKEKSKQSSNFLQDKIDKTK